MEFAPHEPVTLTPREKALAWITNSLFPEREPGDDRKLFSSDIPQVDAYYALMARGDPVVISRFSGYPAPESDDELLVP